VARCSGALISSPRALKGATAMVKNGSPRHRLKHWGALEPIASAKNTGHMSFSRRPISFRPRPPAAPSAAKWNIENTLHKVR
jgi:hypothetical protein